MVDWSEGGETICEQCGNSYKRIETHWRRSKGCDFPENEIPDYRDEDVLKEMYLDREMASREIADELGCTKSAILGNLERHGIERRSSTEGMVSYTKFERLPDLHTRTDGYEIVSSTYGDEGGQIFIHRLLAISKYGFENVSGKQVHHANNVPWDNREENIQLINIDNHAMKHFDEHSDNGALWRDPNKLEELDEMGLEYSEMATMMDCSEKTIGKWMRKYGMGRY